MGIIKVAIADDHKIFRKGVILSLRPFTNIKFVQEAEDGDDLQEDQKEPRAVSGEFDLGLAGARARIDWLESDVVARLDERQRGRRGRREAVGQQMQELAQVLAPRAAKS